MFRVDIEHMPDNPGRGRPGTTGLFRVVFWDQGSGSVIEKNPQKHIHKENLTWDEAMEESSKLEQSLNKAS
jgi:hypothetical protein